MKRYAYLHTPLQGKNLKANINVDTSYELKLGSRRPESRRTKRVQIRSTSEIEEQESKIAVIAAGNSCHHRIETSLRVSSISIVSIVSFKDFKDLPLHFLDSSLLNA